MRISEEKFALPERRPVTDIFNSKKELIIEHGLQELK
jgi:hypothetical protein